MPRLSKPIIPEGSIIRGLILNSKDLFSKEAYEERIDKELTELIAEFRKNKTVKKGKLNDVIGHFIKEVTAIIQELDQIKVRAEQEEILKIDGLRKLFEEESKINARALRSELGNFAKSIKGSTIAALRSNLRGEKRLRRGKVPLGYVLKKVKKDKYLDAEVARRAYRIGEHTAEEHALYYRAIDLINSLKSNPSRENLEQLKNLTKTLIQNYKNDVEDFLNIESGIDIEEARKLHRIDHYIVFLKMVSGSEHLIRKLNALKEDAKRWIYQDTINAKNLERYAIKSFEYGEKLLESSQIEPGAEIPGIKIEKHTVFEQVPGILISYEKPDEPPKLKPNRGLVLVHGAFGAKETLLTLGKRLAMQDYEVFIMDVAQHGDNAALFRLGVISEQILLCVSFLRRRGMKNVGVIGHSLGAMCALFAMTGYNSRIEYQFFEATKNLMQGIDLMDKALNKEKKKLKNWQLQFLEKERHNLIQSSEEYKKLKEVILNGLREMYEGNSKIDAAVLLAPPKTSQFNFPREVAGVIKRLPKITRKPAAKFLSDVLVLKKLEKIGETFTIPEYVIKGMNEPGKIRIVSADVTNMYDTFNYVQNVKNPYDYIDAIKMICKKFHSQDNKVDFIRYYADLIRNVPKLYIYGLGDIDLLKSFIPRKITEFGLSVGRLQITELEDHYKKFGGEIVRIPRLNHWLTQEGIYPNFDSARMPKITYKIVTFFNQYLGRGRLV